MEKAALVDGRSIKERENCQAEACAIQDCLQKYRYSEKACRKVIENHSLCVERATAKPPGKAAPDGVATDRKQ